MPDATATTVYVVPHTHWDREWYATFETFRGQLVQLWDQLLTLTEADPDFRFLMDGQTMYVYLREKATSAASFTVGVIEQPMTSALGGCVAPLERDARDSTSTPGAA